MAGPQIEDRVLDLGLNVLYTEATHVTICSTEPTTYGLAITSATSLGYKSWGAGAAFGSPAAGSPTGRKVSSIDITNGTIVTTGSAQWWAAIDSGNSRLLAHGSLSANQNVTVGNTFTLAPFDIRLPSKNPDA